MRFQKFLDVVSSTPAATFLMLVGFVSGEWLVENLYKIAWPWFYVGFPAVLYPLTAIVYYRARSNLRVFQYLLLLSVSWILSLVVGRLVSSFAALFEGLLPFYQNPWVLALWADYLVILGAMVFAQNRVAKLMKTRAVFRPR